MKSLDSTLRPGASMSIHGASMGIHGASMEVHRGSSNLALTPIDAHWFPWIMLNECSMIAASTLMDAP